MGKFTLAPWIKVLFWVTLGHIAVLNLAWVGFVVPKPQTAASFSFWGQTVESVAPNNNHALVEHLNELILDHPSRENDQDIKLLIQPKRVDKGVRLGL